MNLILFEKDENHVSLSLSDARAEHVIRVLRFGIGDTFDCGVINCRRGKARITALTSERMELELTLTETPAPLYPVTLIAGMPRPQTAKKILREATAIGVSGIVFAATAKSEPAYCLASMWKDNEYLRFVIEGASQAFSTLLPSVWVVESLESALAGFTACNRLACDNYEACISLPGFAFVHPESVLAVGPERGWTRGERSILRESGFYLVSLGNRVLRSETACVSALTLVISGMGLM